MPTFSQSLTNELYQKLIKRSDEEKKTPQQVIREILEREFNGE